MSVLSQREWRVWSAGLALAVAALYIGLAARCGLGFPLDDGWIHQTYARNLAQSGQFAYVPGQVSSGSTSPLWTLLLTVGYLLGLPALWWAWLLGMASWLGTCWAAAALAQRLFPRRLGAVMWVGVACLGEWHLAWAAFSGMETLLFAALSLLLIERYAAQSSPFVLGLIGGLLVLTRPEGIVLLGLVLMVAGLDRLTKPAPARLALSRLFSILIDAAAGLALLIGPYLIFNQIASGQLFPNTFYAKQSEYRELLAQPFWLRLWRVLRRPLIGPQIVLLPGFAWQTIAGLRALWQQRRTQQPPVSPFLRLLPMVWCVVYLGIYAWRLPVDYQYGRYSMPVIPFLLLYGVVGTAHCLRPHSPRMAWRLVSRALPIVVVCLSLAFLVIGARAYADDVCIIHGEMVQVAYWLRENTPPGALVAAHDIGAIGYLSDRPLLDLAGLVTPEIIPFLRDENRLAEFIIAQGADYLVTFPGWYPQIVADERFVQVYETGYPLTRQKGGENLVVYRVD